MRKSVKLCAVLALVLAGWLASGMRAAQAEYWLADGCSPGSNRLADAKGGALAGYYCAHPNTSLLPGKMTITGLLAVVETAPNGINDCTGPGGFTICFGGANLVCESSEKAVNDSDYPTMCVAPKVRQATSISRLMTGRQAAFFRFSCAGCIPQTGAR
jgi:hypothetical protein